MKITTYGLVLKEVKLREADKILTLLTPDLGIVSVSARGAMRPGSKFFSASGLFCYAEWTLHEGKAMYTAVETMPVEVFFGIRQSIEAISLAAYMAEILSTLSPTGDEAAILLKLCLNCLYILCEQKREPVFVKAVFELRVLAQSGYMPEVDTCHDCDLQVGDAAYFDVSGGNLYCRECAVNRNLSANINVAVLGAMRHVVQCEDAKIFSFKIKGESLGQLTKISEEYLVYQLEHAPKTLAFLKTVI